MTDGPLVCVELLRRRGDHTRNTKVISLQIKPALEAEHWELLSLTSAGMEKKRGNFSLEALAETRVSQTTSTHKPDIDRPAWRGSIY